MHQLNKRVFVQLNDIVRYFLVIVIFYCAVAARWLLHAAR